jgi:hydrogenase maturation protease
VTSNLLELPDHSALHTTSAHDTSLQNALKLGKSMRATLPEQIIVVGIATNRVYDFSEELSQPVSQAVSKAAQIVIDLL